VGENRATGHRIHRIPVQGRGGVRHSELLLYVPLISLCGTLSECLRTENLRAYIKILISFYFLAFARLSCIIHIPGNCKTISVTGRGETQACSLRGTNIIYI
jgi:hypothetical protein